MEYIRNLFLVPLEPILDDEPDNKKEPLPLDNTSEESLTVLETARVDQRKPPLDI